MALPRPQLLPLFAVLVASASAACFAAAQPATAEAAPDNTTPGAGIKVSFRPSVAIVVGIFTMIFSLTFLLLMYAKFCHSSSPLPTASPAAAAAVGAAGNDAAAAAPHAGVPKPVIESLPFFRFAALRGARRGLECAVCLARFDDADHLRLLPRCRHAFHLACVDRWLESSASCPLCRARVDAGDAALGLGLKYPSSARIVFGGDGLSSASGRSRFDGADAGSGRDLLDIFVERVPSARFAGDPKRRAADHEEEASAAERAPPSPEMDRHKHRIIVSDVVFKSRWSELNSADLIGLDTELLRSMSSGRFSLPDSPEFNNDAKLSAAAEEDVDGAVLTTTERKRLLAGGGRCSSSAAVDAAAPPAAAAARMVSSGVRSVSEIVSLPRLRGAARERLSEEENRRWLPIARRTARWFGGRAALGRGDDDEAVHVAAAHV